MKRVLLVEDRSPVTRYRLIGIWESAVKATHSFLSDGDIEEIKPEIAQALEQVEHLYCYYDSKDRIQGFIGVNGDKVEMLLVDSSARGTGAGKMLLKHVMKELKVKYVDVNEQNEQGVGFYSHMGFQSVGRDSHDAQGRPFPIVHLRYAG